MFHVRLKKSEILNEDGEKPTILSTVMAVCMLLKLFAGQRQLSQAMGSWYLSQCCASGKDLGNSGSHQGS